MHCVFFILYLLFFLFKCVLRVNEIARNIVLVVCTTCAVLKSRSVIPCFDIFCRFPVVQFSYESILSSVAFGQSLQNSLTASVLPPYCKLPQRSVQTTRVAVLNTNSSLPHQRTIMHC